MIAASNPVPAITRNTRSSSAPSTRTRPTSILRSSPVSATRVAAATLVAGCRWCGPAGCRCPPGPAPSPPRCRPAPPATARTVPSPPQASTTSAPSLDRLPRLPGARVLDGRLQPQRLGPARARRRPTRPAAACPARSWSGWPRPRRSGRSSGSARQRVGVGARRRRRITTPATAPARQRHERRATSRHGGTLCAVPRPSHGVPTQADRVHERATPCSERDSRASPDPDSRASGCARSRAQAPTRAGGSA